MPTVILSLVAVLAILPLAAQEQERPADWKVRFDQAKADAAKLFFVTMTPGWHITTGPAAILYDPAMVGKGTYRVEAVTHLFDPKDRLEGFGIFLGGRDLESDGQSYTYFLIRNDQRFLIKQRKGADTPVVTDWTPLDAIVPYKAGESSVKNVLAIDVGAATVDFSINGQPATSVPRGRLDTEGIVGLRVNHSVNLHVSKLEVTPKS